MGKLYLYPRVKKGIATSLLIIFSIQTFFPLTAFAAGGPAQPEFARFEPVGTDNMVDLFTGSFTYNLPILEVPGPNGSGYPLSLSYHSGVTPEQEASWVGFGWTLNPGAIVRNTRGFPDDYNGAEVIYHNKMPENWTVMVQPSIGGSFNFSDSESSADDSYSEDAGSTTSSTQGDENILENEGGAIGITGSRSVTYNNYTGYHFGKGRSVGLGFATLNYNETDGEGVYSANFTPISWLRDKTTQNVDPQIANSIGITQQYMMSPSATAERTLNKYIAHHFSNDPRVGVSIPFKKTHHSEDHVFTYAGVNYGLAGYITMPDIEDSHPMNVYGYCYLKNANDEDVMDYHTERDIPYTKHDFYLGIPFATADNFTLTGQGLSGGFRAWQRNPGHFRPNHISGHTDMDNIGNYVSVADESMGWTTSASSGVTVLENAQWPERGNLDDYQFGEESDEGCFFRFNNDPGGRVATQNGDNPVRASLEEIGSFLPGAKAWQPQIPSKIKESINDGQRSNRSSYIGWHTIEEMEAISPTKVKYNAYTKRDDILDLVNREDGKIKDGIGEFAVTNKDGMLYTYGLPVYSRNEGNMEYSLDQPALEIRNNHIVYGVNIAAGTEVMTGDERPDTYAGMYLLTSVTTPDYVDLTMDGPTADDFGGWTRFNYTMAFGDWDKSDNSSSVNWWHWRIPYNGLLYHKNEIYNQRDDRGSVSWGEKELYYLESIETKTHIAEFVTSEREDERDAADNEAAALSATAQGDNKPQQLDKIVLYAKDESGNAGEILKTVHFKYDTDLMMGQPNSSSGEGKHTLKKVWVDNRDVMEASISPYQFEYEYKNDYATEFETQFPEILNYGTNLEQNPGYEAENVDPWGYYQKHGVSKKVTLNPWVDQTPYESFDPAAWNLKQITLPSGGQILVQYEQNDYTFVQNKNAMAMVPLKGVFNENERYYLALDSLGIEETEENWKLMRSLIRKEIMDVHPTHERKIYFKFLYALIGYDADIENCRSGFIDGFTELMDVDYDEFGLFLVFNYAGDDNYNSPCEICEDKVNTQIAGNIDQTDCWQYADELGKDGSDWDHILRFTNKLVATVTSDVCKAQSFVNSYVRLPVPYFKKGGGVRVKRLLTYDEGLEPGDAKLYGTEYIYETNCHGRTISSGVATTEPGLAREENPLVNLLEYGEQKFLERMVAGRDKKQVIGPLGESLLPAAHVGYSKILTKNIYDGDANGGFQVNEFHTTKDAPLIAKSDSILQQKDWIDLELTKGNQFMVNNLWLTQGYSFIIRQLSGQAKSSATYSGDPEDEQTWLTASKTNYIYFEPGENIKTFDGFEESEVSTGKEMEIVFEERAVEEITQTTGQTSGLTTQAPFVTLEFLESYGETSLYTHVTNKISRYPAILKRTITETNGIVDTTEYDAFDIRSGQPVVTVSEDAFNNLTLQSSNHNGQYRQYALTAAAAYPEMGQKSVNERLKYENGNGCFSFEIEEDAGDWFLNVSADDGCDLCDLGIYPGDLLKVDLIGGLPENFFHAGKMESHQIPIYISDIHGIQSFGMLSAVPVDVEVIRSGRTNQLAANLGGITTYGPEQQPNFHHNTDPARQSLIIDLNNVFDGPTGWKIESFNLTIAPYSDLLMDISPADGVCNAAPVHTNPNVQYLNIDLTGTTSFGLNTGIMSITQTPGSDNFMCETTFRIARQNVGYPSPGTFILDEATGQIAFVSADYTCNPQILECINSCDDVAAYQTLDNVVSASAAVLNDAWNVDEDRYVETGVATNYNDYEIGRKGKWRPKETYAYRTQISGYDDNPGETIRNHNSGIYDEFTLFNWQQNPGEAGNWLKTNEVAECSPYGQSLEEINSLGIHACVKYGYDQTVPYLVAANSDYESVQFESFENVYEKDAVKYLEDGLEINMDGVVRADTAHTGNNCLRLNRGIGTMNILLNSLNLSEQIADAGLSVRLWVKKQQYTSSSTGLDLETALSLELDNYYSTPISGSFNLLAKTGEWSLLECTVNDFSAFTVGSQFVPVVKLTRQAIAVPPHFPYMDVYVDDIRIQPVDAQVACHVFNPDNLTLLATLNDQHFASLYQYDAEGRLVRKLAETERGIVTLEESHYFSKKVNR